MHSYYIAQGERRRAQSSEHRAQGSGLRAQGKNSYTGSRVNKLLIKIYKTGVICKSGACLKCRKDGLWRTFVIQI